MAESSIPVDLFNPGQVFACLGFLETADVLQGGAEGGFDWNDEAHVRFFLRTEGERNPFEVALNHALTAEVTSMAPAGSLLSTNKWNVETRPATPRDCFPYPPPESPATLPATLESTLGRVTIDHWADGRGHTSRDNVKFWAGSGGYPGAALCRDAIALASSVQSQVVDDPFSVSAAQDSSFRFDWRRDYIPIDAGFSPNEHGHISMQGYPLVELFAAIGLTNARPRRFDKLAYGYGVVGNPSTTSQFRFLDPSLLRASLGGESLGFPSRRFLLRLGWPGQENQARCITNVTEVFTP